MNNDKCEFCNGTRIEPGKAECTWCDNTGRANAKPTTLRWRADGDANTYTLLRENDWVASLRMNGQMLVPQQETILNSFISATNGVVERLREEVDHLKAGGQLLVRDRNDLRAKAGQHKLAMDAACGEIEILRAQLAEQHQGEPVAYQWRCKMPHVDSQWRHWVDCTEQDYRKTIDNPGPTLRGLIREARKLYDRADAGEVERLRAQLAEAHALLGHISGDYTGETARRIQSFLSASAESSAPVERDERAEFERYECEYPDGPQVDPMWMLRCTLDPEKYGVLSVQNDWEAWQARAALERKQTEGGAL